MIWLIGVDCFDMKINQETKRKMDMKYLNKKDWMVSKKKVLKYFQAWDFNIEKNIG